MSAVAALSRYFSHRQWLLFVSSHLTAPLARIDQGRPPARPRDGVEVQADW